MAGPQIERHDHAAGEIRVGVDGTHGHRLERAVAERHGERRADRPMVVRCVGVTDRNAVGAELCERPGTDLEVDH